MVIRVVNYWIKSSKIWIDLVDFFNNYDGSVSISVYYVIERALKCKDGRLFGHPNQKNLLMTLSIESEDDFQKLLSDKILNPDFLISDEEIGSEEFSEKPEETYKNENFFHLNYYKLFKYLEENSFKFEDNSIPLTPDLLDYWYVPIPSNTVYERVNALYKNKNLIDDMDYIIIDEEITCKNGRVLGEKDKIMICYRFITGKKELFKILVNDGVIQEEQVFRAFDFNEEHLKIHYFHWSFKKSKQSFNSAEELADYLKEIDFRFEDNTIFKP